MSDTQMLRTMKIGTQDIRNVVLFFGVIALEFVTGLAVYITFPDWTTRGQFGDMFGIVNALFSGLAFAGVVYAIVLQQEELHMGKLELSRPIITVRVAGGGAPGDIGWGLKIIVENTGNRPAKNIQLSTSPEALNMVLSDNIDDGPLRAEIQFCFEHRGIIPVLANGRETSNAFGWLSQNDQSSWKWNSILEIGVRYEDFNGRTFNESMPVRISDNTNFVGSTWSLVE